MSLTTTPAASACSDGEADASYTTLPLTSETLAPRVLSGPTALTESTAPSSGSVSFAIEKRCRDRLRVILGRRGRIGDGSGVSLMPVTDTVTVAVSVAPCSSVTVYVNVSVPTTPAARACSDGEADAS